MSKQKEEAERFKRINITIDPVIHQKAIDKGNNIRLSLSTLISDLLSLFIDGKIELNGNNNIGIEPIHTGVYPIHTEEIEEIIKNRISAEVEPLRKKIEELQSAQTNTPIHTGVYQKTLIDDTPADPISSSQKPANDGSPVTPIEVSPDPVNVNSVPGNEVSPIPMTDMVARVFGRDVSASEPGYDKIYKRIKTQLKQIDVKIVKKGNKTFYSPRKEILKLIDENIEELKKE